MTGNADMDAFPPMASSIIEGLLSARRAEVEWEQGMRGEDIRAYLSTSVID